MAVFQGTTGADKLLGTAAEADTFFFSPEDFQLTDRIRGGGASATDPLDKLVITAGGIVNLLPFFAGDINGGTGIEQLQLSDQGNSVSLTREFVDASSSGVFEIFGGAGRDWIIWNQYDWNYTVGSTKVIFYGGDGDDIVQNAGYFPADEAYGGAGDDSLHGGFGLVDGGDGNDTLSSGANANVYGGNGSDIIRLSEGAYVDGGSGIDYVMGIVSNNALTSIEGLAIDFSTCTTSYLSSFTRIRGMLDNGGAELTITGGGSFDFTELQEAPQLLTISNQFATGSYQIKGVNTGNHMSFWTGDDRLTGGDAADVIYGGGGNDILRGGKGNDVLMGESGSDIVFGGGGNDRLKFELSFPPGPETTFDRLYGDAGNDHFFLPHAGPDADGVKDGILDGGIGFDTVHCGYKLFDFDFVNVEKLIADPHFLDLHATASQLAAFSVLDLAVSSSTGVVKELIVSGGGVVDVEGKLLYPDAGTYIWASGNDDIVIYGTEKNDTLRGADGNDTLHGRGGDDFLILFDGSHNDGIDKAYGEGGNDAFSGGDEATAWQKSLYGGAGNDTFYGLAGLINGGVGYDTIIAASRFASGRLVSVELLQGNAFVLETSAAIISQVGRIGVAEPIPGQLAMLRLIGSDDFDLTGKTKYGFDISFVDVTTGVSGTASEYGDQVHGTAFNDVLNSGLGDDDLLGDTGDDALSGDGGDDRLLGGAGKDWLSGGDGSDILLGEAHNDVLSGAAGSDQLDGGDGKDDMTGGDGSDRFIYSDYNTGICDIIQDFHPGEDHIELFAFSAGLLGTLPDGTGPLGGQYFQSSLTSKATSPESYFIYDSDDGRLFYDADGSHSFYGPFLLLKLVGAPVLSASDIVLV